MTGSRVRVAVALIAATALVATFGGVAGTAGAGGGSTTIKLGDNFFKPKKKRITKGTKVRFKWIGSNPHNVVKKRGPGGNFASETTSAPGVNFKKRFRKTGRYKIICTIHADEMRLRLRVRRG